MTDHLATARARVLGPGGPFEVVTETVLGEAVEVFATRHRSLRDLLAASAVLGERGYLTMNGRTISFAEHLDLVAATAAALRDDHGIGPGDRVAVLAANCPEYAITVWATISLGAIVAAYNGWWTPDEIEYATELCEPSLLIGDARRLERLAGLDPAVPVIEIESRFATLTGRAGTGLTLPVQPIAEDDPALILFTSGTTGRPKGAVCSHRGLVGFVQQNLCNGAIRTAAAIEATGEAPPTPPPLVTLMTSPMFHVSGLMGGILLHLATGGRLVLRAGRFDEEDVLRLLEQEKVTSWSPLGGLGVRLIEHPRFGDYDTSSLRNISFGGGPTSPTVRARLQAAFPSIGINMGNGYGSSETVAVVSANVGPEYEAFPESAGRLNPTMAVAILDEDGNPMPDGVDGAIHVRSAYSMVEYWRNPDATAKAFRPGRWLDTGDVGRMEDGRLTINSRARDMIIRGGENIYPIEVEHRIDGHPLVAESAVVGVDDDVLGQIVKAIVVPVGDEHPDPARLAHWVGETLAGYKVPSLWEFRTEPLPRNASGKVLKTVLSGEATQTPTELREH